MASKHAEDARLLMVAARQQDSKLAAAQAWGHFDGAKTAESARDIHIVGALEALIRWAHDRDFTIPCPTCLGEDERCPLCNGHGRIALRWEDA